MLNEFAWFLAKYNWFYLKKSYLYFSNCACAVFCGLDIYIIEINDIKQREKSLRYDKGIRKKK